MSEVDPIRGTEHFSPEERERIAATYPEHEREARIKGVPVLGSGRIFPVAESVITCERREIPKHWPRLGAMDFGWDHPFAAVNVYLKDTYFKVYLKALKSQ